MSHSRGEITVGLHQWGTRGITALGQIMKAEQSSSRAGVNSHFDTVFEEAHSASLNKACELPQKALMVLLGSAQYRARGVAPLTSP